MFVLICILKDEISSERPSDSPLIPWQSCMTDVEEVSVM